MAMIRSLGNTQCVVANATSQLLTFQSTLSLLVTSVESTAFVTVGTANTITAATPAPGSATSSIPVAAGWPQIFSTGQQFNQDPGPVYIAIVGSGNVFVSPVEDYNDN